MIPLVQFADSVRPISSLEQYWIPKLREFDEVISWYGANREEFRQAVKAVQPRCEVLRALPEAGCQQHAGDFFLQQVGAPKGAAPKIHVQAVEQRQTLVIHPFSGSASKNWPLRRYQELARRVPFPVEWTAGPEERLSSAVRFDHLLDLAVWMRGAACYLGNDSGISHLAAAIGLPSVVLFGPTDPAVWAPRGPHVTILRVSALSAKELDSRSSPDSQLPEPAC